MWLWSPHDVSRFAMNHVRIGRFIQFECPTLNGPRIEIPNMTQTDKLLAGGGY
jgi:hypothetical protein